MNRGSSRCWGDCEDEVSVLARLFVRYEERVPTKGHGLRLNAKGFVGRLRHQGREARQARIARVWCRTLGVRRNRSHNRSRRVGVDESGCTSDLGCAARNKRTSRHQVAEPILARASFGAGAFKAPQGDRSLCLHDRCLASWIGKDLG